MMQEKDWSKLEELSELKDKFLRELCSAADKGFECLDTKEAGEVADIIKDLAMTKKYCLEAEYYETVIVAMEDGDSPRYGYNPYRYSSGRYAPKGSGSMGYRPYVDQEPYIKGYMDDPEFKRNMRMGYREPTRYGQAYNMYEESKRHYTSTKSPSDKSEMDHHAMEHIDDTITSMRDIWATADTELRKKMKESLSKLVNDMNI